MIFIVLRNKTWGSNLKRGECNISLHFPLDQITGSPYNIAFKKRFYSEKYFIKKISHLFHSIIMCCFLLFSEGVMAQWCNPLTLQPEQSGGVGSNPVGKT